MNLEDATFLVVDVETTGLRPTVDRVVDLAAVKVTASGRELGRLSTLVRPPDPPAGYRDLYSVAPTFSGIFEAFALLASGAILVAHNASFDRSMLTAEAYRAGLSIPEAPWLCTLQLARTLLPEDTPYRLSDLASHLGLASRSVQWHTAEADAQATAQILAHELAVARGKGIETLRDLGLAPPVDWVTPAGLKAQTPLPRDPSEFPPRSFPPIDHAPEVAEAESERQPANPELVLRVPIVVTLPAELLEALAGLPPSPEYLQRRHKQRHLLAGAEGVMDLDDAFDTLDEGKFSGADGLALLHRAIRTFEVAEEWDDAWEALQILAKRQGANRDRRAASETWLRAIEVGSRLSIEDGTDQLTMAIEDGLGRILQWGFDDIAADAVRLAIKSGIPEADEVAVDWLISSAPKDDPERAINLLNLGLDHATSSAAVAQLQIWMARILEYEGRIGQASELLERLRSGGRLDGEIFDRLTLLYERSGRGAEAADVARDGLTKVISGTVRKKLEGRLARINRDATRIQPGGAEKSG